MSKLPPLKTLAKGDPRLMRPTEMSMDEVIDATEPQLRAAMTELEERLLGQGYVPNGTDDRGSYGWHLPDVPVPERSMRGTVAGLIIAIVAILGLVILLRGWPG